MTIKVHGMAGAGQSLTGGLNMYVVRTSIDIRPTGTITDASQKALDKLVEAISTRAQPVILSKVTFASETAPADLPGAGTGAVDVYTLRFAIEHNQAWEMGSSKNPSLPEILDGIEGFVYDIATTTANNISVALVESL